MEQQLVQTTGQAQPQETNPAAATQQGGQPSSRMASLSRWIGDKVRGNSVSPGRSPDESRHSSEGARPRGSRPYRAQPSAAAATAEAGSSSSGGHGGTAAAQPTEAQGRATDGGEAELARKRYPLGNSTEPGRQLSQPILDFFPALPPTTAQPDRRQPTHNAQLVAQGHRGVGT